jgi:hypothetical protein
MAITKTRQEEINVDIAAEAEFSEADHVADDSTVIVEVNSTTFFGYIWKFLVSTVY